MYTNIETCIFCRLDFIDYPMAGGPIRGPGGALPGGAVIIPAAGAGPNPNAQLKQVDRVRNIFPETWLWNNYSIGFVLQYLRK